MSARAVLAFILITVFSQGSYAMATLLHYWPMTETTGHILTDVVGGRSAYVFQDSHFSNGANEYTPAPDATIVPGPITKGRELRGLFSGDGVTPGNSYFPRHRIAISDQYFPSFTVDNDTSFEQWSVGISFILNTSQYSENGRPFLFYFNAGAGKPELEIRVSALENGFDIEHKIGPTYSNWAFNRFLIPDAPGKFLRSSSTQYATWHSLRVVCDGATIKIYYNSTLLGTIEDAFPLHPYGNRAFVGTNWWENYWVGSVAEIEIWGSALTQQEITDLWNGGEPLNPLAYISGVSRDQQAAGWTGGQPGVKESYVAVVEGGALDPIDLRISSWQATLQLGRSSYAQVVVPAITQHIDAIEARAGGTMAIEKRATLPDGEVQAVRIAEVPLQFEQSYGPTNATGTLSGYSPYVQDTELTWPLGVVQTKSIQSANRRFRTPMNPFLRPGDVVQIPGDTALTVSWVNFYGNTSSEYMDFGERAL